MKSFRTILPTQRAPFALTHADPLLLVGSCFTEHIGARLAEAKFGVLANPTGILYNPVSIARALAAWGECSIRPEERVENSLHQLDGLWHSWDHPGAFSHPDRETALQQIETAQRQAAGFLQNASCLLLTLGTAEVFELRDNGRLVANNHKAPAGWFSQRRLSVAETERSLASVLDCLHARFPGLRVILTVSPVRHLRNGFVENQRSKATLVLACAELCAQFPFVWYFPAYELLLDDLRDYRFYAADMAHPSETAVDYIWTYFAETFFPAATNALLKQIEKIGAAARHRPFHPGTPGHSDFARRQLDAIQALLRTHPQLDFSEEISQFQQYYS
ncbi:MAG: GSCFA domain-containing protein [Saprospirales bacterium]|nr:GSCFA domain-containing protein [Saprospirales bacterium]